MDGLVDLRRNGVKVSESMDKESDELRGSPWIEFTSRRLARWLG